MRLISCARRWASSAASRPRRRPQTSGVVERFNGRIADLLPTHYFQSSDALQQTLHRCVALHNHHLPERARRAQTPNHALQNWYRSNAAPPFRALFAWGRIHDLQHGGRIMRNMTQRLALVFGVVFLLVGIVGLFVENGMGMHADMETTGRLFGLFPVNLLHNLVHLAFGAWGVAASLRYGSSRIYGRIGAMVYAALVGLAFIDPEMFGLVPIGSHDIWLHAILAVGLAYIGFAGPATADASART